VRVIVTRALTQAAPLADALRREGFDVVVCPLIEIEPIEDGPIDVRSYDWVIVTSATGAEQLAGRHLGTLPRVAAVGPATAQALRRRGIGVDFVPAVSSQEGLVSEFPRPAGRTLFVGAEDARGLIGSDLGADFRPVYRTRLLRPETPPDGDVVILASSSAVRAWASIGLQLPAISIGRQTSAAAAEAGIEVICEARTADVEGLVDCATAWRASSSSPS
jgi:uroporphyrinogen III methyltransferase / synthase